MLAAFDRRFQHFLCDLVDSTQVHVQVSLHFETGETDVTGEDFVRLCRVVFLLDMGQGATVVRKAGVTDQTPGLPVFSGQ